MDNLYTVKQMAELLGFSKPTIQKTINELGIEAVRTEKNKYRKYDKASFQAVAKKLKPDYVVGEKPQTETEKPEARTAKTASFAEKVPNGTEKPETETEKPKTDYIHHLEEEIAFLKEQIGKKDTEIERLTAGLLREQQLNYDLQNRLLEAPKQPDVSQDIAEPEPEPAQVIVSQPEPQREKRGFWRWLFNK